jgi:hypothetical protein
VAIGGWGDGSTGILMANPAIVAVERAHGEAGELKSLRDDIAFV